MRRASVSKSSSARSRLHLEHTFTPRARRSAAVRIGVSARVDKANIANEG
jgi:hypothetical protein